AQRHGGAGPALPPDDHLQWPAPADVHADALGRGKRLPGRHPALLCREWRARRARRASWRGTASDTARTRPTDQSRALAGTGRATLAARSGEHLGERPGHLAGNYRTARAWRRQPDRPWRQRAAALRRRHRRAAGKPTTT